MAEFTSDWFSYAINNFTAVKQQLGKVDRILEIGSHEGRSTCWTLENLLSDTGTITCIDPFGNAPLSAFSYDAIPEDRTIENRFRSNVAESKGPEQTIDVHVDLSFPVLAQLITEKKQYDFIYVDGGHDSDIVLADAVMCFGMLRPGGVMIFDDYLWNHVPDHLARPKMSVDAFVNMFVNKLDIFFINYQLAVVKKQQEIK
jgi:predicted O-methyltransferase YrrM